jgi:hypothetical protein
MQLKNPTFDMANQSHLTCHVNRLKNRPQVVQDVQLIHFAAPLASKYGNPNHYSRYLSPYNSNQSKFTKEDILHAVAH